MHQPNQPAVKLPGPLGRARSKNQRTPASSKIPGPQQQQETETNGSNKYDYGIFLQLTLKGLGSFGTGDKGFLDDITGYEEREEHNEN